MMEGTDDPSAFSLQDDEEENTSSPPSLQQNTSETKQDNPHEIQQSATTLPTTSQQANPSPTIKKKKSKNLPPNTTTPPSVSVPIKAPKWVPDDASPNCTSCKKPFSFLNRRHHCRRCGGLFCGDCCGLQVSLPPEYGQKTRSRVCALCFHKTLKERILIPTFTTIYDGGPSNETRIVSSASKMFYWRMGAYNGAVFDRTIVDSVENSSSTIPVQQVQDLMIDRSQENLPGFRVRVYTPDKSGVLPILMWCHTGFFCTRNIESPSVDGLCRLFANHIQCIVVSVEYRLAPENKFPAAVEDCYAGLLWAARNAKNMRGDETRMGIAGDGVGGNIAAAVTLMVRDRNSLPLANLRCQVLVCPPLDLTSNATSRWLSRSLLKDAYVVPAPQFKWFADQYLGPNNGESQYASPILASTHAQLPPALIIASGFDPFHSENEAYAEKLRSAGVPHVIYTQYSNSVHGFLGSGLDESDEALMEAVLYIAKRFK